jgi:hypothetical protein
MQTFKKIDGYHNCTLARLGRIQSSPSPKMGWFCYEGCGTEIEPYSRDDSKCSNNREGIAAYSGDGRLPCEICGDEKRNHYGQYCFPGETQTFQGSGSKCLSCSKLRKDHLGQRCYLFKNGYWGWEFGKKGRRCCACYWRTNGAPIEKILHGFESCRQCRRVIADGRANCIATYVAKYAATTQRHDSDARQKCKQCSIPIVFSGDMDDPGICTSQYHPQYGPTIGAEGCCLCIWLGRKQTTMPFLSIHKPLFGMHACQKCIKRVQDAAAKQTASGNGWESPSTLPTDHAYPREASAGSWAQPGAYASRSEPRAGRVPPPPPGASHAMSQPNPTWRRQLFVDIPKTPRPQQQSSTPRARYPL